MDPTNDYLKWQAVYDSLISDLPPPYEANSPQFLSPYDKSYDIPQALTPPNSPAIIPNTLYYTPVMNPYANQYQRMIMPQPYLHQAYTQQHSYMQHQQVYTQPTMSLEMINAEKKFKCPYYTDCKKSFKNPVSFVSSNRSVVWIAESYELSRKGAKTRVLLWVGSLG